MLFFYKLHKNQSLNFHSEGGLPVEAAFDLEILHDFEDLKWDIV